MNTPEYIRKKNKIKLLYFQSRDFTYNVNPPIDFYNNKKGSVYSALEIMEVYAYE